MSGTPLTGVSLYSNRNPTRSVSCLLVHFPLSLAPLPSEGLFPCWPKQYHGWTVSEPRGPTPM
eukprot:441874-Pyramimonas_sp.AAC.1